MKDVWKDIARNALKNQRGSLIMLALSALNMATSTDFPAATGWFCAMLAMGSAMLCDYRADLAASQRDELLAIIQQAARGRA